MVFWLLATNSQAPDDNKKLDLEEIINQPSMSISIPSISKISFVCDHLSL